MDMVYKFLSENSVLIDYFTLFFYVIFSVLLFRKTGDIKYLKGVLEDMKFRTSQFDKQTDNAKVTYSNTKPQYRLNKQTDKLEKVGIIDVNELVNSYDVQTLAKIYERFFPTNDIEDTVYEKNVIADDLDLMQECFSVANAYKEKYNLAADLSMQDVFSTVKKQYDSLTEKIDNYNKVKEYLENEKKKNDETQEQENI